MLVFTDSVLNFGCVGPSGCGNVLPGGLGWGIKYSKGPIEPDTEYSSFRKFVLSRRAGTCWGFHDNSSGET